MIAERIQSSVGGPTESDVATANNPIAHRSPWARVRSEESLSPSCSVSATVRITLIAWLPKIGRVNCRQVCLPFVPFDHFAILDWINTIRIKGRRYLGSLPLLRRKNGIFHIYGTYEIYEIIMLMKQESIRTTVDIPAPLYRKLKEQAAGTGSSIRELVLLGVRRVVLQAQRPRPKRVEFPLIVSKGPQVDLTNEQIYEYVEFP